jgi:hypothetical protein
MRPGLANANGRFIRAMQARLGLADWVRSAEALFPDRVADVQRDCGCDTPPPLMVIEALMEEPWASLTFSGTRHSVELRLEGRAQAVEEALEALSTWTEEAEPLPGGHFLAEVQVTETAREVGGSGRMLLGLRLDALTIEE